MAHSETNSSFASILTNRRNPTDDLGDMSLPHWKMRGKILKTETHITSPIITLSSFVESVGCVVVPIYRLVL